MRSNLPAVICSRSLSAMAESVAVVLALVAPDTELVTSPAAFADLAGVGLAGVSAGLSGVMSLTDGGGRWAVAGARSGGRCGGGNRPGRLGRSAAGEHCQRQGGNQRRAGQQMIEPPMSHESLPSPRRSGSTSIPAG